MNPALGLIPVVAFMLLNASSFDVRIAFMLSVGISLVIDSYYRIFLKTPIFSILTAINITTLFVTFIVALFLQDKIQKAQTYVIFSEICFVIALFTAKHSKKYIGSHYFNRVDIREKNLLREIFSTISFCEHLFTFHLFIVLLYMLKWRETAIPINSIIYFHLPAAILLFLIAYKSYMLRSFSTRFLKEEWLPIVNEQGRVIGKVARSVSVKMKNRFLHPIVRIALVCDGMIYLQKRPEDCTFEPELLDHPFEKYILFKHDLNLAARNSIANQLGDASLPLSFQLKYIFENDQTKRLVLFYVSRVNSVSEIKNIQMLKGKFWTIKQIDDEIHSHIFGECFLREYEYMKNTILNPACLHEIEKKA